MENVFAVIENGTVVNTIVADAQFAAIIGAIPLPEGFGIGDFYKSGVWTKREIPEPEHVISETEILANQITELQLALCDLYERGLI